MSANLQSNRISLNIPDADIQAIQGAIQVLQEKLQPHLVDLDAEGRERTLPKMGPRIVDFVSKALSYARAYPQFRPPFVDLDEFTRDLAAVGALRELQQPLSHIADMVDDSLLLSGSEAYGAALATYHAIKSAAKLHQPGAPVIANDLSNRFPGRPLRASPAAGSDATGPAQPPAAV